MIQFCILDTISQEFWSKDRGWNYDEVQVFDSVEDVKKHFLGEAGKRIGAEIAEVDVEYEDEEPLL